MNNTISVKSIRDIYSDIFLRSAQCLEQSETEETKSVRIDLEDKIGEFAYLREEIGFVNGFRYAMQLAAGCGLPNALEVTA